MAFNARIIADSMSPDEHRLTTMEVTLPRIVLAEFNTHRAFSRNSASSRAIPVAKRIAQVEADPFIPDFWGANQAGMQAQESLDGTTAEQAKREWVQALEAALDSAQALAALGTHKQLANRLLEPFMWQTIIVTATEWDNFFALRDNEMAQPEIRQAARLMRSAYNGSRPELVRMGEWHLPLIQPDERDGIFELSENARKVSVARCARVSYLTHDGVRDLVKDIELYDRLFRSGHMSPFEHVATPFTPRYYEVRERKIDNSLRAYEETFYVPEPVDLGNFRGWKQLRKFMPHEDNFGAR